MNTEARNLVAAVLLLAALLLGAYTAQRSLNKTRADGRRDACEFIHGAGAPECR